MANPRPKRYTFEQTASMPLFSLKSLLSPKDLLREKTKDYRRIVLMQVVIVSFGLVLSEPLLADSKSDASKLIISIFSLFAAVYAFFTMGFASEFHRQPECIKCHSYRVDIGDSNRHPG
jgi:hypothetical protein